MATLDERNRELIALRYGADLTAKQIAWRQSEGQRLWPYSSGNKPTILWAQSSAEATYAS